MRRSYIVAAIAAVSVAALAVVAVLNAALIASWWKQITTAAATRPQPAATQPTPPTPSAAMVPGPWYCRMFAFADGQVLDYDWPPSYRFPYRDVGWITFVDATNYEYRSAFEPGTVHKGKYTYDRGKAQIVFRDGRFSQFYPKEAVYDPARYPGFLIFATDFVVDCRFVRQ